MFRISLKFQIIFSDNKHLLQIVLKISNCKNRYINVIGHHMRQLKHIKYYTCFVRLEDSEVYFEPSQTSMMNVFAKMVYCLVVNYFWKNASS